MAAQPAAHPERGAASGVTAEQDPGQIFETGLDLLLARFAATIATSCRNQPPKTQLYSPRISHNSRAAPAVPTDLASRPIGRILR